MNIQKEVNVQIAIMNIDKMSLTKNIMDNLKKELDSWTLFYRSRDSMIIENAIQKEQERLIEEINKIPNELSEYEDIISRKEVIKLIKGEG